MKKKTMTAKLIRFEDGELKIIKFWLKRWGGTEAATVRRIVRESFKNEIV